jgi:hypothetical protein
LPASAAGVPHVTAEVLAAATVIALEGGKYIDIPYKPFTGGQILSVVSKYIMLLLIRLRPFYL